MVLLDTSVLIDVLRGVEPARNALIGARRSGESLVSSCVVRAEILAGMRSAERPATSALLASIGWLPVDEAVGDRAGALARAHRRSMPGVDNADFLIAATAEIAGARLWTRNVRHFPFINGLAAPYPG